MADNQIPQIFNILSDGLEAKTWRYSQLGIANAEANRPFVKQTIKGLVGAANDKTCLVVSGGQACCANEALNGWRQSLQIL